MSYDPFADDDKPLEVPFPSHDELDALEASLADNDDDVQSAIAYAPQQTYTPGERVEHDVCGKTVLVKKDGTLAAHKCEPKPQRGNRLETLPDRKSPIRPRTREFAVGVLSWCVEEGSATVLARPFGCDPGDVPTDLPDAEAQIGTPLDLLWPEIPDGARKFIDKLADNADVIDCGIAWFEWGRNISRWAREQRRIQTQLVQARQPQAGYGQVVPFIAEQQEG